MRCEKDYVTLELAKLLKNAGFDDPCEKYININTGDWGYCDYDHIFEKNSNLPSYGISYPLLYEAQKWVRENLNIHIVIDRSASGYYWTLCKADTGTFINNSDYCGPNDGGKWDSYEEALNAGIEAAILWKRA